MAIGSLGTAYVDIVANTDKFQRDSAAAVKKVAEDSNKMMATIGEAWGRDTGDGFGRSFGQSVTGALGGFASVGGKIGTSMGPGVTAALVGALVVGLAAATPLIAGAMVAGIGAYFQRDDPILKAAAQNLGKTFNEVFTRSSRSLVGPLVNVINILRESLLRLEPLLTRMFAAVGPLIQPLVEGFIFLAENALPGFVRMLEGAAPVFNALKDGLAFIGTSLSVFFDLVGGQSEGVAIIIKGFLGLIGGLIVEVGLFLAAIAQVASWIKTAVLAIGDFFGAVAEFFAWGWESLKTIGGAIVDFFLKLPGRILTAVGSLATLLWSKGVELVKGLSDGAYAMFKGVWDWFVGFGKNIVRAVGNLAYILWDAGVSIIRGLWEGAKAMWENVKSFFSSIGDWIADHKGPLDYDRKLLVPAGQAIMQGLMAGLQSEAGNLAKQVRGINGMVEGIGWGGSIGGAGVNLPALGLPGSQMTNNFNQQMVFNGPADPSLMSTAGKAMNVGIQGMLASLNTAQTVRSV